jgi:Zn-dependent M28 family amino/carboxypeptidase
LWLVFRVGTEAFRRAGVRAGDELDGVRRYEVGGKKYYADEDPDKANHYTPIVGADDGASGVGVLLEIARLLNDRMPDAGVDIIFFDAEDYGTHSSVNSYHPDSWCLGSQFWAKNPHVPNYRAEYGILLDMVGHRDAVFYKELTSLQYAAKWVELIWQTARDLGYGRYFIQANGGNITDDHQPVIRGRNIPCVDIIYYDPNTEQSFGKHWHTLNDTMENIDRETLKAVGQTVLEVIFN